jgi:hypothetical protein
MNILFRKYIIPTTIISISTVALFNYSNKLPKYILTQLPFFQMLKHEQKQQPQYVIRTQIESDLRHFMIHNYHTNKYCLIYGPNGIGKSRVISSVLGRYSSVFKININKNKDLNYVKTTIMNELNPMPNQNFVKSFLQAKVEIKTEDIIESLKKFNKEKFYKPKIVFDFDEFTPDQLNDIKAFTKMISPYCQVFIILANLPENYVNDFDEFIYSFEKNMTYYEACQLIRNIDSAFKLSEDEFKILVDNNYASPTELIKLAESMKIKKK